MKRFTLLFGALLLGATSLLAQTFMVDGINYRVLSDSCPFFVQVVPLNHADGGSETHYSGDIVIPGRVTYAGITYTVTYMVDGINYHVISDSEPYMVEVVPLNHAKDESEVYYSGDIVIPEQITYAGITYAVTRLVEGAFQSCQNLHSVVIPNSVTFIGTAAFNGCTNLTSVVMPKNIIRIESTTFSHCTSLQSIEIPNTVIEIARLAFLNCSSLTSIDIPNSVTFIGEGAFLSCTNLQSVKMSNSVERIEAQTFLQCSSLQTIDIPNSVTFLGEKAFLGCTSLQSISMSNYIRFIENETFCSCSSLKTLKLPNSLLSINKYAFAGCKDLSSIVIPSSVTSIEMDAFAGCYSLTSFFCYNKVPPQIFYSEGSYVPNGLEGLSEEDISLYVPFGCINNYQKSTQWKDFLIKELSPMIGSGNICISGTVFFDENENGIQDNEEYGIPRHPLLILPDSIYAQTDNSGNYSFSCGAETVYQIIPLLFDNWKLTTETSSNGLKSASVPMAEVSLETTDVTGIDFGIKNIKEERKTEISIISLDAGRCFETFPMYLAVKNNGTVLEQGRIQFNLDPRYGDIRSASQDYDMIDSKTLCWNMSLRPFEERKIKISMHMPDFNFTSDTLESVVSYKDAQSVLSSDTANVVVRCSYDPNDKTVFPMGVTDENLVLMNEPLSYTIRFQNTGNDYAKNVVVIDTLSSALDLETFEVVAASHNLKTNYTSDGVVEFRFDNIMLLDSTTNEPESHGFVKYRIKAKKDLPDNTVIENTAHIYFDYNPAVVTNTTMNTMTYTILKNEESTAIEVPYNATVKLYPNPIRDYSVLEFDNAGNDLFQLTISDVSGKVINTMQTSGNSFIVGKGLDKGVYLYSLKNTQTNQVYRNSFIVE